MCIFAIIAAKRLPIIAALFFDGLFLTFSKRYIFSHCLPESRSAVINIPIYRNRMPCWQTSFFIEFCIIKPNQQATTTIFLIMNVKISLKLTHTTAIAKP